MSVIDSPHSRRVVLGLLLAVHTYVFSGRLDAAMVDRFVDVLGTDDCPTIDGSTLLTRDPPILAGFVNVTQLPYAGSLQGIDVSKHNRYVVFDKLRACGARFAYIRVSGGGTDALEVSRIEPASEVLWRTAIAADLVPGPYHFLTMPNDLERTPPSRDEVISHARVQARVFLARLKHILETIPPDAADSATRRHLPIVLDVERRSLSQHEQARTGMESAPVWMPLKRGRREVDELYRTATCAWLDEVALDPVFKHQKVMIYTTAEMAAMYLLGDSPARNCRLEDDSVRFWIARYTPSTLLLRSQGRLSDQDKKVDRVCRRGDTGGAGYPYCPFHQYSEKGRFGFVGLTEGTKENRRLDIDRFFGSLETMRAVLQDAPLTANPDARLPLSLANVPRQEHLEDALIRRAYAQLRDARTGTKRTVLESADCQDVADPRWPGYPLRSCTYPTQEERDVDPTLRSIANLPPVDRTATLLNVPVALLSMWTASACEDKYDSSDARNACIDALTQRVVWYSHAQFVVDGNGPVFVGRRWRAIEYRDGVAVKANDPDLDGVARKYAPASEVGVSPRQWSEYSALRQNAAEAEADAVKRDWRMIVRRERLAALQSTRNHLFSAWANDCLDASGRLVDDRERRANICALQ